jgi:hypothetical protein
MEKSTMRARSRPLVLEHLEDRTAPATFGNPWLDARHLTLSFVPDGTKIGGQSSQLFQVLNADTGVSPSVWEMEILRAVQAWTSVVDVDVGIVPDGGQRLGLPGRIHGDPRFGDIRIAGAPMSGAGIAIGTPYDPTAGTLAGDVIFNTSNMFGIQSPNGFDIYTTMIHEMGHVLGLDHSTDPASVMYSSYSGPVAGLAASDIAAIQGLYDPRQTDQQEMLSSNGNTAAPLSITDASGNYTASLVEAELNAMGSQNIYSFTTGATPLSATVSFRTSGLSLLEPSLTVTDALNNVILFASSTSPLAGDLSGHLNFQANSTYYITVKSPASNLFAIGLYHLTVQPDQVPLSTGTAPTPTMAGHLHGAFQSAIPLTATSSVSGVRQMYRYKASISDSTDTDYYVLTAPANPNGTHAVMTITGRAIESGALDPNILVYNAAGKLVNSKVLTHDSGTFTIQVPDGVPGNVYYIEVLAQNPTGPNNIGNYSLSVDFRTPVVHMIVLGTGALQDSASDNSSSPTSYADLELDLKVPMTIQFVLSVWTDPSAGTTTTTSDMAVQMTIKDSSGNVVAQLTTLAGQSQSVTLILPAGTYYITLQNMEQTAGEATLDFELDAVILSQPLGSTTQGGTSSYSGGGGTSKLS